MSDEIDVSPSPLVRVAVGDEPSKRCTGPCGQLLSLSEPRSFHAHGTTRDGWQPLCRVCANASRILNKKRKKQRETIAGIRADIMEKLESEAVAKKEAKAFKKELSQMMGELRTEVEAADLPPENAFVLRKLWPTDPDLRLISLLKALPEAIKKCDGQEAAMAAALNIGIDEIMSALEGNDDLYAMYEQAQNTAIAKVEAVVFDLASKGSGTDARWFLQHNRPEKYGSKTQVDIKGGFGAPNRELAGPVSVLSLRKVTECESE